MKTVYSFEDLPIEVNPKALFEQSSHEARSIVITKKVEILSRLILLGYDLQKIVESYLEMKVASNDIERINHITDTFNAYTDYVLTGDGLYLASRLKSELKKSIVIFEATVKEKIVPLYSLEKLISAFSEDDSVNYGIQREFWNIDLLEDLSLKLRKRDLDENTVLGWHYVALFDFFNNSFLGTVKSNRISYWEPSSQMPSTPIMNAFIKKYLPKEDHSKLNEDDELRKEYLIQYAKKIIEILWFNKPLFDEPIFLIRCNYKDNPGKDLIPYFYENNIVSICIQDFEKEDQDYYNKLIEGKKVHNNKLNYISRFIQLAKEVKKNDVLVIVSYLGLDTKIGLIKKGTEIVCDEKSNAIFYCLKLKSVYCTPIGFEQINSIDLTSYPILKSIIPQQVTISAVNQRKNNVYSIYYGIEYPVELCQMTNSAVEMMCMEWLRSKYSPDTFRIECQLIRTGGNYADVDILGIDKLNFIVAGQVSFTNDKYLLLKKVAKLNSFKAHRKMIFSMVYEPNVDYIDECKNIYIGDVWTDFNSDKVYKHFVERLLS